MYKCIINLSNKITNAIDMIAQPILLLIIRLYMSEIFLRSGLIKLGDMKTTLYLFQYEYKIPYLPFEFAAYSATFFEIVCSAMLIIGLGSRLAALILFIMSVVIQFTYLDLKEHFYWMFMFATIFAFGPGKISFDFLISKKLYR